MSEITQPEVSPATPAAPGDRARARALPRWVLITLTYAIGARALYWHFSWIPSGKIPLAANSDQAQQVWFLAWMAHAVSHLQNPFFSTALNYPHGVNLITNTATPLLGIVFAPLTYLSGPLTTYVVLLELGFVASALSAAVVARKLGSTWWAAWFVGVIFGFCAHRVVEGSVHVFLVFDVIMPWILFCAIRFSQRRWTPVRFGVSTGVLLAVDFLMSTERVGVEVFALVLCALADVLSRQSRATWRERARELVTGYAIASLVGLALAALPLWYFFFGPQSISGSPHQHVRWQNISLSQLVQPGGYAWWAPFGHTSSAESILQGVWNNTGYLGAPLALLAIIGLVRHRREPLTRAAGALSAVFLVMALGPSVRLSWIHLSVWSPSRLVTHIPGLQDILPFRYMEIVVLGVAWLASRALVATDDQPPATRRNVVSWASAALALMSVATLIPNQAIAAAGTSGTPFLSSPAARRALPENSVVLTYPYPVTIFNTPMLDQARSGLWYQLIGGQAIVPGPNGHNQGIFPLRPRVVFDALYRASQPDPSAPITSYPFSVGPLPPLNSATSAAFVRFVTDQHVNEVFWRQWGYHPALALAYLTNAFGPGVAYDNDTVRVWHIDVIHPQPQS